MIQKIKNVLLSLVLAAGVVVPVAPVVAHAQADIQGSLCAGANLNADGTCDQGSIDEATTSVNDIMTDDINIFSLVVGVVSVIMIIIGGLKYITSAGDSGNVSGAKNTILYAIIGLVIVALAQIIVRFVLAKVGEA